MSQDASIFKSSLGIPLKRVTWVGVLVSQDAV